MIGRLFELARPYRRHYLGGFALLLVTNALALWLPWLLGDAIRALEGGAGLAVVAGIGATMIGAALAQAGARVLSRLAILGASRHVVHDLRDRFFDRLRRLGPSFYDRERTGDVMSRGVNDVQLVQSFFGPGLMNLLNTAIVYAGVVVLLLRIDPLLTAVALAIFPLLFLGVNRISRHVYARSMAVQEQLSTLSSRVQENLAGHQQVKIHAQEEREIESFRGAADEYRKRNLSLAMLRGAMVSLIGIGSGTGTLVVLFVGGSFVVRGRMGFGEFVTFNAYLGMLAWPTVALGWIVNVFQRGTGALARLGEILDREPDADVVADGSESVEPGALVSGTIEIRDLHFSYPGASDAARRVLRGISLTIPAGSRVALVGPVGSGKTTLVQLLARMYPVPRGAISIGGEDVNDIPLGRLRRSIGFVPQDAFLFSQSLGDNVRLGDPGAADDAVAEAIDHAHLSGDLRGFPAGLDTLVGERGVTLSGGQRQRTTLARALLGQRPILVLDDSLASVDADAERAILDRLAGAARDRTLILVSHRLAALADVDRVVVLDEGRVVEVGTHAELVERGGVYASLFRRRQLEERLG